MAREQRKHDLAQVGALPRIRRNPASRPKPEPLIDADALEGEIVARDRREEASGSRRARMATYAAVQTECAAKAARARGRAGARPAQSLASRIHRGETLSDPLDLGQPTRELRSGSLAAGRAIGLRS